MLPGGERLDPHVHLGAMERAGVSARPAGVHVLKSWDSFKSPDTEMQTGELSSEKMPFLGLESCA